jgi:hypothetical protein
MDTDGMWMINNSVQSKTSWFPYTVRGVDKITYDSDAHHWVDVYTDNLGGYGVTMSPGWAGNAILWTDAFYVPSGNVVSESPTTVTKVSDSKMTSAYTFKEKSGATRTVTSDCTKSS